MKSFSKRVASFTMAAAMVLSLAAVSPVDAQAAKKASITKKTSITAGKTYTYKIKNVTSKQYVKVTGITSGVKVKYNNKTVKKNSTKIYGKKSGAALALKVTAKDKVANYKATIKAQVYNKSNNKKVGSLLKTTTKVKCTKLAVDNVKVASTRGKYLVATFNKALTKLSSADITIKNTATGELKGVEKVELASDGKSATVTLVGSEDTIGTAVNTFVEPNVDYSFSVSQSGATATTVFSVDAVEAGVTVLRYDVANKKITVTKPLSKNTNTSAAATSWSVGTQVTVPENVYSGDYEKLLGTTVTVSYDKNNNATKLTSAKETVVYGSFKYVTANTATPYLENIATKEKFYTQPASGDLWASEIINEKSGLVNSVDNALVNADTYDYAKVVLYNNGCVKTFTGIKKFDGNILVDKVEETAVSAGTKTVINLKDFKIIKDGELSSVAGIAAGDVVFYDTTNKLAEIYNDKTESTLQAAYAGSYKFNDTLYNYTIDGVTVKYVDGSNGVKNAVNETMESFLKGGPAIKVYFDRAKRPVFVEGTKAAAEPSDTFAVVLTADGQHYRTSLDNVIRLKGYNGTATTTYNVNVAELTKITTSGNYIYKTGAASAVTGNSTKHEYVVTGFNVNDVAFAAEDGNAQVKCDNVQDESTLHSDVLIDKVGTEFKAKQLVELTTNKDGKVTGISLKKAVGNVSGNFTAGASNLKVTDNNSYQIAASTPVYVYNVADNSVSKVEYSKFSGKATTGNAHVYSANGKDVAYVVVESIQTDTISYVQAVVSRADKTADGTKIANLIAYTADGKVEYSKFSDTAAKTSTNVATGKVIRIGLAADGETVETIDTTDVGTVTAGSVSHNTVNANEGKYVRFTGGVDCAEELATSVKPIIVKIVMNGQAISSVEQVNFSELYNLDSQNVSFGIETTTLGATSYIDTIVITVY